MAKFNYHTVTRKILADLYTPVGVYMRLRDIYPQSALMESSDYHGSENSRSFIGVHPLASIAVSHGEVIKTYPDGSVEKETLPAFGEGKGEARHLQGHQRFHPELPRRRRGQGILRTLWLHHLQRREIFREYPRKGYHHGEERCAGYLLYHV
jgi:anthranilate/para-aminobenzoate synthase component I